MAAAETTSLPGIPPTAPPVRSPLAVECRREYCAPPPLSPHAAPRNKTTPNDECSLTILIVILILVLVVLAWPPSFSDGGSRFAFHVSRLTHYASSFQSISSQVFSINTPPPTCAIGK